MSEKHANYYRILERERLATLSVLGSFIFYEQTSADQIRQVQMRLRRMSDALRRLDDGVFGVCQVCTGEIQQERLAFLPYAELCFDCQRQQEKANELDKR